MSCKLLIKLITKKQENVFSNIKISKNQFNEICRHFSSISPRSISRPVQNALESDEVKANLDLSAIDTESAFLILKNLEFYSNFISETEENNILKQVDKLISKRRYEQTHWDYAILEFREIECQNWDQNNRPIIDRIQAQAFRSNHPCLIEYKPDDELLDKKTIDANLSQTNLIDTQSKEKSELVKKKLQLIPQVHILDLAANGCIKPHVDATRFCGPIIAGLSLASDCVMRFAKNTNPKKFIDLFLPRRSLYVMSGYTRYECTHEIFGPKESRFKGKPVPRARRVSLLFRCHPL